MEIIKIYTRDTLVKLGLCEECEETKIDIEALSKELYERLQAKPYDQLELARELHNENWDQEVLSLCMNYLKKKNLIVYVQE